MHRAGLHRPRRRGHHDGAHEEGAQGSGPRRGLARCWTLYNLSWAVLALKAAFSMTRTTNVHGAVVWEYPRFERQACASAAMYARCDAKVALHPSPSPTSPRPATAQMCLPHRLCELQEWLIDERGCLTEWPVLLDLRAQQQAV